ncbi:MAG TPA: rRNA maturation RNase YbeY [Rhizomicrobium sp.]
MKKRGTPVIEISVEDVKWKKLGPDLPARIERAIARTLAHEKAKGSLTLLLTDDAHLKDLNALFRGKNKPTNVLSFPAEENADRYLGDIAIALGVVKREAKEAGKTAPDHTVHLAVHGALHLLGHDHEKPREAARMERLETEILAEFGIADPYALPKKTGSRKSAERHG